MAKSTRKIVKKFEVGFEEIEWKILEPVLAEMKKGLSVGVASIVISSLQNANQNQNVIIHEEKKSKTDDAKLISEIKKMYFEHMTELRLAFSKETHLMREAIVEEDNHSKQIVSMSEQIKSLTDDAEKSQVEKDDLKKRLILLRKETYYQLDNPPKNNFGVIDNTEMKRQIESVFSKYSLKKER